MSPSPVEQLWGMHDEAVHPYPTGVITVPERISGRAFFPGGLGLTDPQLHTRPDDLVGCTMVVGHDFHSEEGYRASLAGGAEPESQPTWRNMTELFARAGPLLPLTFFTNFYMGLRQGKATTGVFPGSRDAGFVERCGRFFLTQLQTIRPSAVITLGRFVPPLVASVVPGLERWKGTPVLKRIDEVGPVVLDVPVADGRGGVFRTNFVALCHPSFRPRTVGSRFYDSRTGDAAEVAMLDVALPKQTVY